MHLAYHRLQARIDINRHFVRVDVHTGFIQSLSFQNLFILYFLKTKVPLMHHTKFQPNIPSHYGAKVDFIDFATF